MIIGFEVPLNPVRILIQKYPPQLLRSHTGHRWEVRAYLQALLAKKGVVDRFGFVLKIRFEAGEQNEGKVMGDIVVGIGVHCEQWSSFAVAQVTACLTSKRDAGGEYVRKRRSSDEELREHHSVEQSLRSRRSIWLESVLFRVETCILR